MSRSAAADPQQVRALVGGQLLVDLGGQHCEEVGRDHREIQRTLNTGPVIIRDSTEEAAKVLESDLRAQRQGGTWSGRPA